MVDPLVVGQHKDNQVLFILAYSLFMIEVRYGTVRYGTVRYGTVRAVPELITCLSPSHPPDHEVVISLFDYPI